jgi:TetR/AcrR family transcriptional regulator, regulator of cefoperazone and chloramphenicol sensitivity
MHAEIFPSSPGKGEQARRRLLIAALEIIGEKGYENASVREIAEAAGQNIAAISYYFGSKEKLYAEVLEGIGNFLRSIIGPLFEESQAKLESGELDPVTATAMLKKAMGILLGEQLGGTDFLKIRLVMMREQSAPSESFEILYRNTLSPLHQIFFRMLAVAIGEEPGSLNVSLRAHAIIGQVLVFTFCRASVLRSLNADHYSEEHITAISTIINQNLDRLCSGGPFPPVLS